MARRESTQGWQRDARGHLGTNFKLECYGDDSELQETESAPRIEPKSMVTDTVSSIDASMLRGSMRLSERYFTPMGKRGSDLLATVAHSLDLC